MEILENRAEWAKNFKLGWLAEFKKSGKTDRKLYSFVKNKIGLSGSAIDLSKSRLTLITSAGSYLRDEQQAFNAEDPLGDYDIRLYPSSIQFTDLDYAHTHYDHEAVDQDPQVLVPLRHLEDFKEAGTIGELSDSVISFMGYQPDVERVIDETIPKMLSTLEKEKVDAVLLVPA